MARILVVDDQPEVAELVQAVLKDEGHAADAVYSGQAALDRLTQTVYDLVVCDVRIPDVDGKAVFRAVAQLGPFAAGRAVHDRIRRLPDRLGFPSSDGGGGPRQTARHRRAARARPPPAHGSLSPRFRRPR
jgi:CheY-like chemotaxis protein